MTSARRSSRWMKLLMMIGVLALAAAACGDDDGGDSGDGAPDEQVAADDDAAEAASLTVATPFPSGLAFPDLYIADAQGYFAEENLEVTVEPLDGSGATLQALETDSADVAVPSPGPVMQGVQQGAEITSIFTSYHSGIFSVVTTPDSGIEELADLQGASVGVGALDGGEVPVVTAMLADAGLEEGTDYELLAVGDGGTALTALRNGDVAAYGAAFIDVLIIEGSGQELVDLTPEQFVTGTDVHFAVGNDMLADESDIAARFTRALAKGAAWLQANPDEALDVVCGEFPEECEDEEFARDILDAVIELETLPESADGQYGYTDLDNLQVFADTLAEEGELEGEIDVTEMFSNEFIEEANDFGESDL